jgi:hypothetical protein
MANLVAFFAAAMLIQPAPPQHASASKIPRLEALAISGQAE